MSNPTELLPCPFCGSKAILTKHDDDTGTGRCATFHAQCSNRACTVHPYIGYIHRLNPETDEGNRLATIEAWNTRPAPPPQAGADMSLDEIADWCEQTFGPITMPRMIERAKEEFQELEQATDEGIAEEAADVVIVLSRVPNLWAAIQKKMEVNKGREWGLKGDGTGYHKKIEVKQAGAEDAEGFLIRWAYTNHPNMNAHWMPSELMNLMHEYASHIAAKAVEDSKKQLVSHWQPAEVEPPISYDGSNYDDAFTAGYERAIWNICTWLNPTV